MIACSADPIDVLDVTIKHEHVQLTEGEAVRSEREGE